MDANGEVLILGVGNILLKDEGTGVRTVEHINSLYELPAGVEAADGGTGAFALISLIKGFRRLIVIDVVKAGGEPGAIYRIPGSEIESTPSLMTAAHSIGIADILKMAELEEVTPGVVVIGVEPLEISAGLELTGLMRDKLPEITEVVSEELELLGFAPLKMRADA